MLASDQIHASLTNEHTALREKIQILRDLRQTTDPKRLTVALTDLKMTIQANFRREEVYYRVVDQDKRLKDRGLIHQLRNDHAALIFGMESLAIRLRKNGPVEDWWQ